MQPKRKNNDQKQQYEIDALIELQIHKLILVLSLPATFSRYFPYRGVQKPHTS